MTHALEKGILNGLIHESQLFERKGTNKPENQQENIILLCIE
jgi:hypothetical protein